MASVPLPDLSQLSISGRPDQDVSGPYSQAPRSQDTSLAGGPSPDGPEPREEDEEDWATLPFSQASLIEEFFRTSTPTIGLILVRYRKSIDDWEEKEESDGGGTNLSIVKGSVLVDQAIYRIVFVLESLVRKKSIESLVELGNRMGEFLGGGLDHHPSSSIVELDQDEQVRVLFWNGLNGLAVDSAMLEERLSEVLGHFSELSSWLDEELTPILAELVPPTATASEEVDQLLDMHSELCELMSQSTLALEHISGAATQIRKSINTFQSSFSLNRNPPKINSLKQWARNWTASLAPLLRSLHLLIGISEFIQAATAGTPHAIYL